MHPFRRFVQDQMDARGWKAADLSRQSGVSKAVLSTWLTDDRDRLSRPPAAQTIAQLAKAFGGTGTERVLWVKVAQSMGLPVDDVVTTTELADVPDVVLLHELLRRAERQESADGTPSATITAIDDRRARPPAEKRAARRPKDGPEQPIS